MVFFFKYIFLLLFKNEYFTVNATAVKKKNENNKNENASKVDVANALTETTEMWKAALKNFQFRFLISTISKSISAYICTESVVVSICVREANFVADEIHVWRPVCTSVCVSVRMYLPFLVVFVLRQEAPARSSLFCLPISKYANPPHIHLPHTHPPTAINFHTQTPEALFRISKIIIVRKKIHDFWLFWNIFAQRK